MLRKLQIKNFAIIEEQTIELADGSTSSRARPAPASRS